MQNMPISIIEFSIENFKIFKEKITFSMSTRKSNHSFEKNGLNLLKTSLIYGPNASGKSTLLEAFLILRNIIINSTNNSEGANLPYHPFLLSEKNNNPTFYEVIFVLENKIFRYNFSILEGKIFTENLFEILFTGKDKKYFLRKEQSFKLFNDFKKNKDIADKTRKEVLFLSAASQWNHKLAMKIVDGFKNINIISGLSIRNTRGYTVKLFKDTEKKKEILNFLKKADFCINDGIVEKIKLPDFVKKQMAIGFKEAPSKADTVFFSHSKFNSKNKKIGIEKFNMGDESAGTQKFFEILGPIIDTLENGKVLLIDEFDNSLHPLLTKFIIDLFEKNNPNNAQLIVTTHDTNLLSYKNNFIKDQFWFTEKDQFGAGKLFSLAEFESRNDTEFSKKYLEGRFGALPFIEPII
jgi:uncharacterized protein